MENLNPFLNSFAGGEVSPETYSRVNLEKYNSACRLIKNFVVLPQGGADRRSGFEFVKEAYNGAKAVRLIDFDFSTEDNLSLEFGDYYIRFFDVDGPIYITEDDVDAYDDEVTYDMYEFCIDDDVMYMSLANDNLDNTPATSTTKWIASDITVSEKQVMHYMIKSPFSADELEDIKYDQSADIIYMNSGSMTTQKLSRYSNIDWVIEEYVTTWGPFDSFNTDEDNEISIKPTNTYAAGTEYDIDDYVIYDSSNYRSLQNSNTGHTPDSSPTWWIPVSWAIVGSSMLLTAEKDTFSSSMIGRQIRIRSVKEDVTFSESFATASFISSVLYVESAFTFRTFGTWTGEKILQTSIDDGDTWKDYYILDDNETTDYTLEGSFDSPTLLRLYCAGSGTGTIELVFTSNDFTMDSYGVINTYTDAKNVVVTVGERMSFSSTSEWALSLWNSTNGYPKCLAFHQGRIYHSTTDSYPLTIVATYLEGYQSFKNSIENLDDESFSSTLTSRKVNKINNLLSLDALLIFTSGAVSALKGQLDVDIITPTNKTSKVQEYRGSSTVDPIVIGNMVIFVQNNNETVRSLLYNYNDNLYVSDNVSILAQHLFSGKVILDILYQENPNSIAWFINDYGELLGLTFLKEHKIVAWHQHETDGLFKSMCNLNNNGHDEMWYVIEREINGNTVKYIEKSPRWDKTVTNCNFLDCYTKFTITDEISSIDTLDYLEKKTVYVYSNGTYQGPFTVTSGSITLSRPLSNCTAIVGLKFTSDLVPLQLDYTTEAQTTQDIAFKIPVLTLKVVKTMGGKTGKYGGNLQPLTYPMGTNIRDLYTGDVTTIVESDWVKSGNIIIRQDEPYPMTITGILPKVEYDL